MSNLASAEEDLKDAKNHARELKCSAQSEKNNLKSNKDDLNVIEKLWDAIRKNIKKITDLVDKAVTRINNLYKKAKALYDAITSAISKGYTFASKKVSDLLDKITEIKNLIKNYKGEKVELPGKCGTVCAPFGDFCLPKPCMKTYTP